VLDKGAVIATVRSRAGDEKLYKATKQGVDLPLAVLVNGYSASGSEMFSGAVQDNHRGGIIGTQTFGKGIVQSYFRLNSNGGWVKITTDAYFTPSGVCIHGVGIKPDIPVELAGGKDEYVDISTLDHADDAQLQAALTYLAGQNGGN
jgi:carboxyl-terminal processing protease